MIEGSRGERASDEPEESPLPRQSYDHPGTAIDQWKRTLRGVSIGCLIAFGAQLVLVLVASTIQFQRFGLAFDFSTFNQAAYLISHGDLLPFSSTLRHAYLDDHFGLLMYPIALLDWVLPHGILLLWLQDLAGVAAEVVAFRWVYCIASDRLQRGGPRDRRLVAAMLGVVTVLMLLNPWFYIACLFDFHLLAFAALFLVCTLFTAWRGRVGWASFWAGALLLTGDTGGLYLIGAGLSVAIASPTLRRRVIGLIGLCIGGIWLVLVTAFAVKANSVIQNYSWLITGERGVSGKINLALLVKALVLHPHRQLQMIWGKRTYLYKVLIPTGVVGVVSPWMWGAGLMTFYAMALAISLTFLVDGFNLLAGFFVGVVATAMVLSFLLSKQGRLIRGGVVLLLVLILGQSIALAVADLPGIPSYWYRVSTVQASVLSEVLSETPENAEVIASNGVMGRFSDREAIYCLTHGAAAFPVWKPTVIFVFAPHAGIENLKPNLAESAIRYVRSSLHAKPLVSRDGIYAFRWHPGRNTVAVDLISLTVSVRG